MGRKKLPRGFTIENLEVLDAAAEGKSVARWENKVVFVNGAVPGDICDVQIFADKRRFLEGRAIHFHKRSEHVREAHCSHFGECGGCKWQNLDYSRQLFYKQKQVVDQFTRIGHLDFPEVMPILGAKETEYYRNKLEYTFSHRGWITRDKFTTPDDFPEDKPALGYHVPIKFDKVIHIEKCYHQKDPSNAIRNWIFDLAMEKGFSFFNLYKKTGLLRNLVLRNSTLNEWMVIVIFGEDDKKAREIILNGLKEKFPEISSLQYIINTKVNDSWGDQEVILYHGKDHIVEEMEGLHFRVRAKSFYQVNPPQAYRLYSVARDFAGLTGEETVYDLYTGTGTIAQFVAGKAKKVVGIEYVEDAIKDAWLNAEVNAISNVHFEAGDMKEVLNDSFIQTHGHPDVIITDPPRAGMHEEVVQTILKCAPEKIVYVSCNPASQARDLALMQEKYRIEKVQPVDMFPHTHHVENVVLLVKK